MVAARDIDWDIAEELEDARLLDEAHDMPPRVRQAFGSGVYDAREWFAKLAHDAVVTNLAARGVPSQASAEWIRWTVGLCVTVVLVVAGAGIGWAMKVNAEIAVVKAGLERIERHFGTLPSARPGGD